MLICTKIYALTGKLCAIKHQPYTVAHVTLQSVLIAIINVSLFLTSYFLISDKADLTVSIGTFFSCCRNFGIIVEANVEEISGPCLFS